MVLKYAPGKHLSPYIPPKNDDPLSFLSHVCSTIRLPTRTGMAFVYVPDAYFNGHYPVDYPFPIRQILTIESCMRETRLLLLPQQQKPSYEVAHFMLLEEEDCIPYCLCKGSFEWKIMYVPCEEDYVCTLLGILYIDELITL